MEKELKQLNKEIQNLFEAMTSAADVPELAKQLQDEAKRRTIVANGLEGKVRAELEDIRKHLESSDVHELRHELKQHITEIRVDSQGQIRIEGSLVGALDSVLKLVAGAGLEPATSRL